MSIVTVATLVASLFSAKSGIVQSFESALGQSNQSSPRIRITNNGDEYLTDVSATYYFTSPDSNFKVEPWYFPGGSYTVGRYSGDVWALNLRFANVSIAPGSTFPDSSGIAIGLHRNDWSKWSRASDPSNNRSSVFLENQKIVLASSSQEVSGSAPTASDMEIDPSDVDIRVMSREDALQEANISKVYIRVQNNGKKYLNGFQLRYLLHASDTSPVLESWYIPGGNAQIVAKSNNYYEVLLKFPDAVVAPGAIYPNENGIAFGIHYANWSTYSKKSDYSCSMKSAFNENDKIEIEDMNGTVLSGDVPDPITLIVGNKLAVLYGVDTGWVRYSNIDYLSKYDSAAHASAVMADKIARKAAMMKFDDFDGFKSTLNAYPDWMASDDVLYARVAKDIIGLTKDEFKSQYDAIFEAYERVVRVPLFDFMIEKSKQGTSSNTSSQVAGFVVNGIAARAASVSSAYDSWGELSSQEQDVLLMYPFSIDGAQRATRLAKEWTAEQFPGKDPWRTSADAFRHAAWNALLCSENGNEYDKVGECVTFARRMTRAHEEGSAPPSDGDLRDQAMDLHNNKIGQDYIGSVSHVTCPYYFCWINGDVVSPSREEIKAAIKDKADKANNFWELYQLHTVKNSAALVYFTPYGGNKYCGAGFTTNCTDPGKVPTTAVTVGVLKHDANCVNGQVTFRMDDEDDDNNTSSQNVPAGVDAYSNTILTFCKETFDASRVYPKSGYDMIVLRMSDECPDGAYPFARSIDNEDDDNNNSSIGDISPSVMNNNTRMEFCFVPADLSVSGLGWTKDTQPWSQNSGVFIANSNIAGMQHGTIYTDSEDDDNSDSWDMYSTPDDVVNRIHQIIWGTDGTSWNTGYLK